MDLFDLLVTQFYTRRHIPSNMHFPYTPSAASVFFLSAIFATTVLSQGSFRMVNHCPEYVLYEVRVGSTEIISTEPLDPGQTYSLPFSKARPHDPTANHTFSFDAWSANDSDKKMRSVRRGLLSPRQSDVEVFLEGGFGFLLWDVTVTEQGVAYGIDPRPIDPFPRWGWTWKLASGDESCTPCTSLGCAAEGCSPQEDVLMEFCGGPDTPGSLFTSANNLATSISVPTSSPTVISLIDIPTPSATTISVVSIPIGSATPVAPSATRTYPQYTTITASATASGPLFPGPSGSGAVLPSGGAYNYQPSPLPAAFTGAASKLQEGFIGAFALAVGWMML